MTIKPEPPHNRIIKEGVVPSFSEGKRDSTVAFAVVALVLAVVNLLISVVFFTWISLK